MILHRISCSACGRLVTDACLIRQSATAPKPLKDEVHDINHGYGTLFEQNILGPSIHVDDLLPISMYPVR